MTKNIIFSCLLMTACSVANAAPPAGTVIGWGENGYGGATGVAKSGIYNGGVVTVDGAILTNVVRISAGSCQGLALRADGSVVEWGLFGEKCPDGLTNAIAISAGGGVNSVVTKEGKVISWGLPPRGSLDDIPVGLTNIVAVSLGGLGGGLALSSEGRVFGWPGYDPVAEGLSNIVSIAVAQNPRHDRFLALKADGTLVGWHNIYEWQKPPPGLSNVVSIALGNNHALAVKNDGTVFGWGANASGQATGIPSDPTNGLVRLNKQPLTNVVAVACGQFQRNSFSMALKKDGTVVTWGFSPHHQVEVPSGLSNVVAIAAGANFCLAITTNNAVAEKFRH